MDSITNMPIFHCLVTAPCSFKRSSVPCFGPGVLYSSVCGAVWHTITQLYMPYIKALALKLTEFSVDNFKATSNAKLELSPLTALVGANGSGKTTFLEALDHFIHRSSIKPEDYQNPDKPIIISAKFTGVPRIGKPVTIKQTWRPGEDEPQADITPKATKLTVIDKILDSVLVVFERAEHETDNDGTTKSDLDLVKLIKKTVNDEISKSDTADVLAQRNEYYQALQNNIVDFTNNMNAKLDGDSMDSTGYAPGSKVAFNIKSPDMKPDIETAFIEHDKPLTHKSVGHGTKRAYHMAALETYADMSIKDGGLLLILVDEPELHQHPQRQRSILKTYKKLADRQSCQLVYSTHSPEFIDLSEPQGIYMVTRDGDHNIVATTVPDPDDRLLPWNTSRKLVEGIFSAGVILVEGWQDEVLLNSIFSNVIINDKSLLKILIERDIHIIFCNGVPNMSRFLQFFRALDIRVFALWDADGGDSKHKENKNILDALGSNMEFSEAQPCSECYPDTNCICFACDACLYFKDYLGFIGEEATPDIKSKIKALIKEKGDLTAEFSTPEFQTSDFVINKIPMIPSYFFSPTP